MTEHPLDDLTAYALGDLDPTSAEAVMTHADACPTCAAALADAMKGVAALASAETLRSASATARGRGTGIRWLAGLATAATLLLGAWNLELRATAPTVPVDALVHSHFTHHPLTGSGGNAKLIQAVDGSWVYLVSDGLRPFGRYRLSVNGDLLGTVAADAAGRATGYWVRSASVVKEAELAGSDGSALRWAAKE